MKIETHCHSSGVSVCADYPVERVIKAYEAEGYGAVTVTNHYNAFTLRRLGDNLETKVKRYIAEVKAAALCAKKIKVFLGAEVALSVTDGWAEFLLFGISGDFLLENPTLYELSQKQLYKLCNDNKIVMIQSHPFRIEQGHQPQDPEFMDGVEINCHPDFLRNEDKVREFAEKNNLRCTCGSDFHGSGFRPCGGVEAEGIDNVKDLAEAILNGDTSVFYK